MRYGGHTSCVALQADGADQPDLLLDAGTGIRDLDRLLRRPFDGSVVLSHLHWDHVQGLPFSTAALDPAATVRLVLPAGQGRTALQSLLPGFAPPSFPVPVDELTTTWSFAPAEQEQQLGRWAVSTAEVRHKGGRTIGIRVELDGRSLVYLPDHDLEEPDPAALQLARGADVLVHDAQYTAGEIRDFRTYGHSTIERACAFAAAADVGHLVLSHHAPNRTDDELDRIAAETERDGPGLRVTVAVQGSAVRV